MIAALLAMTLATIPSNPVAEPFPLSSVRVTGGPFAAAEKRCANYLLEIEPDRLLSSFRKNAGLEPKAKIYGGWENSGLAGHSLGHYLTALSQEYAATKDARYKEKIDYVVSELKVCQDNRADGYIAAMPDGDRVWSEVKRGEIRSGGFDLNGLWSPWYTHHKVLAGLLDANKLAGSKVALAVAKKFADWAIDTTQILTPELWEKMLACEYGGMNDSLAELYSRTKEQKYLDLARKFYDHRVLDPLAKGEDSLPGRHSNTQIPKLIGLARLYELTGQSKDKATAQFFWNTVVHHHTYAIGGNSNHEYFGPADKLSDRLSTNTCETCNTYNMLKLTRHLFMWEPKAEYADFYERAHLNHILASQNPDNGMMTYFMPLSSGARRSYSNRFNDWTCCHGSGMENHTKHADSIYFHSGKERLYVNLFIPSELEWEGAKLKLSTEYPADGKVMLAIESGRSRTYEMAVRHPGWLADAVVFKVNGKEVAQSEKPGAYALIKRTWKAGDKLEFELPLHLRTEAMPDNPKQVAVLYGPLVLAADLGSGADTPRIPVLVTESKSVESWLQRTGSAVEFRSNGIGRPEDLTFRPFYASSKNRYAVYFGLFTQSEWEKSEADYRAEEARVRDLEARTIDYVRIGEMQPERDHKLKSERNDVRSSDGRSFRSPLAGGWFEFELKTDPATECDLVVSYWGNERMRPDFEILVDGDKVADEDLKGRPTNRFFDVTYKLPKATGGTLVIRFQAKPGKTGGSVCGARLVRR